MDDELLAQVGAGTDAVAVEDDAAEEVSGQITMDESGELNIPNSFWDDDDVAETDPEAPYYTPEEVAKAFENGDVEPERLRPEVRDYYSAIDASARRRADAQRIQQEMRAEMPQQAPQPAPAVSPTISTKEQWAQLADAAKALAAWNYLGISPDDFDEYDPNHTAARNMAMQEIRERAQVMYREQEAAVQRQAQTQRKAAEVANLYAEYRQKEPEMDRIGDELFPAWREGLTVREYKAVDEVLASGDVGKIKGLFDRLIADYKKGKGAPRASRAVQAPPSVEGAVSAGAEDGGVVDIKDFGSMTPDEQAAFLIENKFTG